MKDVQSDLAFAEFVQFIDDRVKRALHVSFDDEVESLGFASLNIGEQIFEGNFFLGLRKSLGGFGALIDNGACFLLGCDDLEDISSGGHAA